MALETGRVHTTAVDNTVHTVAFSVTPTGATGTATAQWYIRQHANDIGTLVSGSDMGLTYTYTVPTGDRGRIGYIQALVTDSAGTDWSSQVPGVSGAFLGGASACTCGYAIPNPATPLSTAGASGITTLQKWFHAGDSITRDTHYIAAVKAYFDTDNGLDNIQVNGGSDGTKLADWQKNAVIDPGRTQGYSQLPGYDTYNNYEGMLTYCRANGIRNISLAIGRNDAFLGVSTADSQTLYNQLLSDIAAETDGSQWNVVVHDVVYGNYNGTDMAACDAFNAFLDSVVAGHTAIAKRGDKNAKFGLSNAAETAFKPNDIHPTNDVGYPMLGAFRAYSLLQLSAPSPAPDPETYPIMRLFFRMDGGVYATQHATITPDDDHDIPTGPCVVYVGSAGDVQCMDDRGEVRTYKNMPAGTKLPIITRRVLDNGTTAHDLIALY